MARTWLIAFGFAAGILAARRSVPPVWLALALAGGAVGATVRALQVRVVLVVIVAVGAGWLIGSIHAARAAPIRALARSFPRCEIAGTISQRSGLGTFVRLRAIGCGEVLPPGGGEVVMDVTGDLGSRVHAEGWLVPLEEEGFDGLRARAGAAAAFRATSVRIDRPGGSIHSAAAAVRRSLRAATAGRKPAVAGLTRGLAIGETDLIPATDSTALRRAGLSHLVAVSGTNVTIVLTAVAAVAGRFSRRLRIWSCAGALLFFVAVVGPEPSVLRAAAMGAVGLAAVLAGSRGQPLNALALAVTAVLAMRPPMVHALGLHLSVAATAGICLWANRLERRLRVGPRWLRAAAAVTISAQIAVAPLLIATFGEVSATGLPANLLAAPAVAPATVLALAAALVGLAWPAAAAGLVALAAPCVEWIALMGRVFGSSEGATLTLPRWSAWAVAACLGLALRRRALLRL